MQMGINRGNITRLGALQRKRRNSSAMFQMALAINKEADEARQAKERQREAMFNTPSELFMSAKSTSGRQLLKSSPASAMN